MEVARTGLEDLRKNTDALIIIPNEKLLNMGDRKMRITEAFAKANELLRVGVQGIVDLINHTGYINVDFADVKTVMSFQGEAIMGQGIGKGDNRAIEALKQALSCPLAENTDIDGAKGLLVNITAGDDLGISEYDEVMAYLAERVDHAAVRKMGLCIDPSIRDEIRITVIATGFNKNQAAVINAVPRLKKNMVEDSLSHHMGSKPVGLPAEAFLRNEAPAIPKTGLLSSDAWEKLTSGKRYNSSMNRELDESIPSYLRMQNDGK